MSIGTTCGTLIIRLLLWERCNLSRWYKTNIDNNTAYEVLAFYLPWLHGHGNGSRLLGAKVTETNYRFFKENFS